MEEIQATRSAQLSGVAADVGAVVPPVPAAARMLGRLVRFLPMGERARYREELAAELYDQAAAGATRRAQLGYALRLTVRVWSLRRALRSPARERAR